MEGAAAIDFSLRKKKGKNTTCRCLAGVPTRIGAKKTGAQARIGGGPNGFFVKWRHAE